jgi:hypothetical protein
MVLMGVPQRYIKRYLNGKGAVVKGAGVVSERPKRMAPASDVTGVMRRSFEKARTRKAA